MESFLSPIYINLSDLTDERLCIALMAVSNEDIKFDFSEKKLKTATSFLPNNLFNSINRSLKTMKKELAKASSEELVMFKKKTFKAEYFDYLSKYSHGIISFSEPRPIAQNVDKDTYKKYFEMFVGDCLTMPKKKVKTFRSIVNSYIKKEPFKKVDTHFDITPKMVNDSIFVSHKLDFIGKNGSIYAGKSIDFNIDPKDVESRTFIYNNLVKGLKSIESRTKLKSGKYELFFNPPESKEGKAILDKARKHNMEFRLRELEDLDKVADTLENGNYSKFSEAGIL